MANSSIEFNLSVKQSVSPLAAIKTIRKHYFVIRQMTKREILSRYKGSMLGVFWSLLNPLLMLLIYTFVFSEIFKTRWEIAGDDANSMQFALIFFVGLIVQGLFAEILNRSPTLIVANCNYVKKIMFPLEILPVITVCTALFNSFINILVLMAVFFFFKGYLVWTLVFAPIILLPLILFSLGISWILASLGVFLRDINQTITVVTSLLMFLSPVFYPLSAVPERFRPIIMMNPLTFIIEQARAVILWGQLPNWKYLFIYTVVATFFACVGYVLFQKIRKGFADVL